VPEDAGRAERPWPRLSGWRRFGPAVLVVAALVVAGVVATVRTPTSSGGSAAPPPAAPAGTSSALAIPYQTAEKSGRVADFHWPAQCDHGTGRLKVPSVYAPPCVPVFHGDNGGAMGPGVTATTINIVAYQAPPGDLTSAITGATNTPQQSVATAQGYVQMFNQVAELYGRHVNLIPFYATGTSDDAEAGRADAITVAEQLHAFASISGPAQTPAYQDELAQQHVLCISCGYADTHSGFVQDAPYLWGLLPAPDTLLAETFRYVISQLNGRDAIWAGEPSFTHRKRVFAVVHYDQNPPVYGAILGQYTRILAKARVNVALQQSYLLDLSQLPSEAATIAAHLARSGATTVVFVGDPIMPIYLTKACAALGYYPEWVISGTVFTDTSTLGRYFDQKEWAHAFGISALGVPLPLDQTEAVHVYRWYFGTNPPAARTATLILPGYEQLFSGLELAGPHLTPTSFQQGVFRLPPGGGGVTTPLAGYGYNGAPPLPAYSTPSDYTFIWYDAAAKGTDEQGVYGAGMVRFVAGGRRYLATHEPASTVPMFDPAGTVMQYPVTPKSSRAPNYPPWPGSPAAHGGT
jgi:hypothetical protein